MITLKINGKHIFGKREFSISDSIGDYAGKNLTTKKYNYDIIRGIGR